MRFSYSHLSFVFSLLHVSIIYFPFQRANLDATYGSGEKVSMTKTLALGSILHGLAPCTVAVYQKEPSLCCTRS